MDRFVRRVAPKLAADSAPQPVEVAAAALQSSQPTNENKGKGKEKSTGQPPKAHADTQA